LVRNASFPVALEALFRTVIPPRNILRIKIGVTLDVLTIVNVYVLAINEITKQ